MQRRSGCSAGQRRTPSRPAPGGSGAPPRGRAAPPAGRQRGHPQPGAAPPRIGGAPPHGNSNSNSPQTARAATCSQGRLPRGSAAQPLAATATPCRPLERPRSAGGGSPLGRVSSPACQQRRHARRRSGRARPGEARSRAGGAPSSSSAGVRLGTCLPVRRFRLVAPPLLVHPR